MSKTVTLTIGERISALKLFDAFKGTITALASVMDDIKATVVTSEEWVKADKKIIPTATGESWQWTENDQTNKEITMSDDGVAYLLKSINERSEKKELGLDDAKFIDLSKKLA